MKHPLKYLSAPLAFALAFVVFGAPNGPVAQVIPTSGLAFANDQLECVASGMSPATCGLNSPNAPTYSCSEHFSTAGAVFAAGCRWRRWRFLLQAASILRHRECLDCYERMRRVGQTLPSWARSEKAGDVFQLLACCWCGYWMASGDDLLVPFFVACAMPRRWWMDVLRVRSKRAIGNSGPTSNP